MNTRMKVSFWMYLLTSLLLAAFSATYLFRSQFMPYHAVEVGMSWEQVPQGFQIMIISLMKSLGGAWLSTLVAFWAILFVPFRRGERWAIYMLPVIGLTSSIPSLYSNFYIMANTPAEPPWIAITIGIVLIITAFLLSLSKE